MTISVALALALAGASSPENPVRMNQLGFQPSPVHRAIVPNPSRQPLPWTLENSAGATVARGTTRVFGADVQSGEHVHRIDFAAPSGSGYKLRVGSAVSRVFAVDGGIYKRLPYDSLNYFYQNRAGTPIEARFAGGAAWARPAGHAPERASCVAGKDPHGNDWSGCSYTLDVTGGWYDAGDHGKYVVNGGISIWTLLNLYERQKALGLTPAFADGQAALPEAGNGVNDLLDEARWELEFFLKMQVPDGTRMKLPVGVKRGVAGLAFQDVDASGLVHHKVASERWTGVPTPPQLDRFKRILFPPSTSATLNSAAAMGQCARIWSGIDAAFAQRCLAAGEKAWAAAARNPELYAVADFTGSGGYGDGDFSDEFYWAAAELFVTTGKEQYLAAVRGSPHFRAPMANEPSWPGVATLGTISLATLPSALADADRTRLRQSLVAAADSFLGDVAKTGYAIPYASQRWPWGSTSTILNRAMILGLAHDITKDVRYRTGVTDAMDFVLGRNALDQSFVSGYGARPMRNPHHRFWGNMLDAKLPIAPPGAISGGPNNTAMSDPVAEKLKGECAPQKCWADHTGSYALNEVAINWNAPLVWVSAWLAEEQR